MNRFGLVIALVALFLLLPGCQLIDTVLDLAPYAIMFLEAPEAVEPPPADRELAAVPVPLDEALDLYLAEGATGTAWLVPAGQVPPPEATTPSRPGVRVCRLPITDTPISPELLRRMHDQGMTLVRISAP